MSENYKSQISDSPGDGGVPTSGTSKTGEGASSPQSRPRLDGPDITGRIVLILFDVRRGEPVGVVTNPNVADVWQCADPDGRKWYALPVTRLAPGEDPHEG